MTDSTKQLFNAPFVARNNVSTWGIEREDESLVAVVFNQPNMRKIAKLFTTAPELYDALMEAAAGKCWSCAGENTETMLDHPCPKGHDEDCYVAKWRELLRKVRDGK